VSSACVQPVDGSKTVTWPLGHGLVVALVYDFGGVVRNVLPEELQSLGLSEVQAKGKAIANLEAIVRMGVIGERRFPGPGGRPFVLFGGHWAAATCILLSELRKMGLLNIETDELCVCIPHREALLMFAKGDHEYRETMLKMIREHESDDGGL
jgi:hypothetical protein